MQPCLVDAIFPVPSPGTDAAARTAAAFASCSALYNDFPLSPSTSSPAKLGNSSYAATLLTHANQLYTFAQQTPQQTYSSAISGVDWAYASSSYNDDLVLADITMALAVQAAGSSGTSPQSYLDSATSLYSSAHLTAAKQDVVMNWDSVTPAIPVLLTQISNLKNSNLQPSGGVSQWQNEAETYFDRIVQGKGIGYLTRGGNLWYEGDSNEASLNPALNAAQLMFTYAPLATTSDKTTSYQVGLETFSDLTRSCADFVDRQNFAKQRWDYLLGNNPMSSPYIVGSNPNSPTNPHDAKSSGGNDITAIDTNPANSSHILYGAVVGGPDNQDRFWNIRSDWPETEVCTTSSPASQPN